MCLLLTDREVCCVVWRAWVASCAQGQPVHGSPLGGAVETSWLLLGAVCFFVFMYFWTVFLWRARGGAGPSGFRQCSSHPVRRVVHQVRAGLWVDAVGGRVA